MNYPRNRNRLAVLAVLAGLCLIAQGCHLTAIDQHNGLESIEVRGQNEFDIASAAAVPREKEMTTLPAYVIEPPDILLIDAVKVVPKPPYHVEPLDMLQITAANTLLDHPIADIYAVDPGGTVSLGPAYGSVKVLGLTIAEATAAIDKHLRITLREPQVSVSLAQTAGQQQIVGEHLVAPDGTVNLGTYGSVYVAGLTLEAARNAIETHLADSLESPKISIDVFAYNSKVYYIIIEGAGLGDQVVRVPSTGNETVLDAIAQVNGLTRLSSKNIWIARPVPRSVACDCDQILPVRWGEITRGGSTETNYQVLPGDRIFVAEDRLVAFDNFVTKATAPFERMFGFTLLGTQAIQTINRFPKGFRGSTF